MTSTTQVKLRGKRARPFKKWNHTIETARIHRYFVLIYLQTVVRNDFIMQKCLEEKCTKNSGNSKNSKTLRVQMLCNINKDIEDEDHEDLLFQTTKFYDSFKSQEYRIISE
jgi:hypothetical protein